PRDLHSFPTRRSSDLDTGTPAFTRPASRTMSQFASRIQPWLTPFPIVSGSSVPWMPIPRLFSAIQITPTGLFGPGLRIRKFLLRSEEHTSELQSRSDL